MLGKVAAMSVKDAATVVFIIESKDKFNLECFLGKIWDEISMKTLKGTVSMFKST